MKGVCGNSECEKYGEDQFVHRFAAMRPSVAGRCKGCNHILKFDKKTQELIAQTRSEVQKAIVKTIDPIKPTPPP